MLPKRRFLRPNNLGSNGLSEPRSLDRVGFVTQIVEGPSCLIRFAG